MGRELLKRSMAENAQGDHVHIFAQGASEGGNALALTDGAVGGAEEDAAAAELGHAGLETDARSQRRFLEDHAENAAGQIGRPVAALESGFQSGRLRKKMLEFVAI